MRDFLVNLVRSAGEWGVGLLMLVENVFPPIPSELIMPLGGYLAETGSLSFWLVVLLGSIGSLLGALLWYWVGRKLGRTVISVPAGITGMALLPFLRYSAAGTFTWTLALAWAGRILGSQFPQVGNVLGWVTWVVIGGATAWYIYRVVKVHRKNEAS